MDNIIKEAIANKDWSKIVDNFVLNGENMSMIEIHQIVDKLPLEAIYVCLSTTGLPIRTKYYCERAAFNLEKG
jgi:hypothetical protein